jgi:hypothetical protein
MKNKDWKGIMIMIVTVFIMFTILHPKIAADPSIIIANYEIFPNEFMPGDKGILLLTIQNTETQASTTETTGDISNSITITENNGVVIEKIWINPAYDDQGNKISSTTGFNGYKDIGNIAPGASFQLSFEIVADENLSEGYYFLDINIDLKNDEYGNYEDVTIPLELRVSNETVVLLPSDVPSKISIGGSTDVSFTVVNKRKNHIDGLTIVSDENNDLDFKPESIFIGQIEAGKSEDVIFSVNPDEIGNKILSLNLSYLNGDNLHFQKYEIPIEIVDVLDVAPIFTNIPSTIKKGGSSRIGLEVYNAKTESITGVIITPSSDATVIPSQYFIGAMDPDDVFSASFDIYSDMLDYGAHIIEFKVSYKQGNEYYETPSISHSFKVVSGEGSSYQASSNDNSESTSQFGGDIFGICLIIIPIIIILIVVFVIWRWKKGRKTE